MNKLAWKGQGGVVKWGYHLAAQCAEWAMATEGTRTTLTATILTHDTYAVSQQPLTFEVPRVGKASWRWSVSGLQIVGSTLTAALIAQE